MILRPYQLSMVDAIRAAWAAGAERVLGCLPTGGGKTEIAIAVVAGHPAPGRALIVVERKTLCRQWVARLHRHGFDDVGVIQGDNTRREAARVLVATAQTIRSRGVPAGVGLVVIDESHIWHKSHDDVLEELGQARVLGLTATPLRDGLGQRFDRMVVGATIRSLIAEGHLVPARYFAPRAEDIAHALEDVAIRAGDYALNELALAMRGRTIIGDVVGTWLERGEDRQTICFCVDKQHAHDLVDAFLAEGVAAEVVVDDTDDDERARIFGAFEERRVRVLVSVGVLAVGFDSPVASCAILARPTMSLSLHIQQGGRVLRPCAGKHDALVLDHAGNTLAHGLLEEFEPPPALSMIDAKADKKRRRDAPQAWICRHCEAVNALAEDVCCECGATRRRATRMVVVDGELHAVDVVPDQPLPGPTLDDLRTFYRQALWHAAHVGLAKVPEFAFYATLRRFKLDKDRSGRLVEWGWRYLEPMPTSEESARWFRADYQRQRIVRRYVERRTFDATV